MLERIVRRGSGSRDAAHHAEPLEKLGWRGAERHAAARRVEDIGFADLDPRKFAAALAELVAQLGEFFLLAKKLAPGGEPFLLGDDGRIFEGIIFHGMRGLNITIKGLDSGQVGGWARR